jgi:hypothetical protein
MANYELTYDKLNIKPGEFSQNVFNKVAQQQLTDINARLEAAITRGRNAKGQAIKPGGYKTQRTVRVRGRASKNYATSPVNLQLTGDMRKSKQVKEIRDGAELFFNSGREAQKAAGLHARGFNGWHEFADRDIEAVERAMADEMERAMARAIEVKRGL